MKRFILGAAREITSRLKMKKFVILTATVLVVTVMAPAANAAFTPILPAPPGEPSLDGPGGILDSLYGLSNLERIMDSFIGDQLWHVTSNVATATAVAKESMDTHMGGVFPGSSGGTFISLLPDMGGTVTLPALPGPFRFGLMPSGAPLWSSRESDNSDGLDHMVTWRITNMPGSFVTGWEDLVGLGDQDYNDLVIQVNGAAPGAPIPEPGTLLLLGTGFVGMGTLVRRQSRRK